MPIDIRFSSHGSIVLAHLDTAAAREWFDENVNTEPWQYFGDALAIEARYAPELAVAAHVAGLCVVVEG